MFTHRKRVSILKNGHNAGGKVVFVPDTWDDFLNIASGKLNIDARRVYNERGCELDHILLLCNDDVLYIAADEPFKPVIAKNIANSSNVQQLEASGSDNACKSSVVKLNIGGKYFSTSRTTMLKEPNSILAKLADGSLSGDQHEIDESGTIFIDRNPAPFMYILQYLRGVKLIFDAHAVCNDVFEEAKYFSIDSLVENWKNITSCVEKCPLRQNLEKKPDQLISSEGISVQDKTGATSSTLSERTKLRLNRYPYLNSTADKIIKFNVGGKHFATLRSTILQKPDSMLAKLVDLKLEPGQCKTDDTGSFFIDRSPVYFEYLLNYLRGNKLTFSDKFTSQQVLEEAYFFGLDVSDEKWKYCTVIYSPIGNCSVRNDLVRAMHNFTDTRSALLKYEYVILDYTDLSGILFQHIDFKCASLRGCNISNSVFGSDCIVNKANFNDSNMNGVKFLCSDFLNVQFQGANMDRANFQSKAVISNCNFRGANLACLSGSASFISCQFVGSQLLKIKLLPESSFKACNFTNAKFGSLLIRAGGFGEYQVQDCDFSGANLQRLDVKNFYISNESLDGAVFNGANLTKCVIGLQDADLKSLFLKYNNFRNNFKNADFTRSVFQNCFITIECLKKAKLKGVILGNDIKKQLGLSDETPEGQMKG